MSKLIAKIFLLLFLIILFACNKGIENQVESNLDQFWSDHLIAGFENKISGVEFNYHSPHPDVRSSLISRATDGKMVAEWQTAIVPEGFQLPKVTFIWISGVGANIDTKNFAVSINDEKWFTFQSSQKKNWSLSGPNNSELSFQTTFVDDYKDYFGYMYLKVPTSIVKGKNLTIKVVGENAESNAWFMVFQEKLEPKIKLFSEQSLLKGKNGARQNVRVGVVNLNKPITVKLSAFETSVEKDLNFGYNSVTIPIGAIKRDTKVDLKIDVENKTAFEQMFTVNPVRQMEIHLLHHSHLDIGYTHTQDDVLKLQFQHLENAVKYAEASQHFPLESQFKWNAEQMWHVDAYLKQASNEKRDKMIYAIKNGWISLDALYANMLTGLCRPEELLQTVKVARDLKKQYDVNIESAMITDIPGHTWGLVPALALSGVKYLSLGPNFGHRVGHVYKWADQPFYWLSPSSEEKILCWVHGKGYSWFHSGLNFIQTGNLEDHKLKADRILPYIETLVKENYPFDLIPLRYSIGADNGPPDPLLSQVVKAWNEKYISPKLVISTTVKLFSEFEIKYGDQLQEVRGDFTPYWEDGAASTARETAMNREASERMVQASTLWTMVDPENYPAEDFEQTWQNILLFDEHTWGAHNSISEPDAEFVKSQWKWKENCVLEAEKFSRKVLNDAINKIQSKNQKISTIDVFNTTSWNRSDFVILPKEMKMVGDKIQDENKNQVYSQRLSSGELVFIADDVPSLGTKRFFLVEGSSSKEGSVKVENNQISNEFFTISVDQKSGALSSIKSKILDKDLVDKSQLSGLCDYTYVAGRDPQNKKSIQTPVKILIKENGPVITSIIIESNAPGCNKLTREIRIYSELEKIDIINILDRPLIRDPEGIHFGFPFKIPNGQIRVDSPFAIVQPEIDQIKGACKNWFTVQRWVDVSNEDYGVTLAILDAPMLEVGEIMADATYYGWTENLKPSQTLYSYVMNNYWETNYKAEQPGFTTFRYSIWPHKKYEPAKSQQFGIESSQPLIAVEVDRDSLIITPLFKIKSPEILVTLLKPINSGKEILIRLFNTSDNEQEVELDWQRLQPENIYVSNLFEEKVNKINSSFKIRGFGIETIIAN